MKPSLPRRTARILTALLAAASVATSCSGPEPHHIVLMSYNIRNGIGADNVRDLTRTADVIRRTAPDFVALQEVDSATRRSEGRFVAAELGRLTGMHARFGRAIDFEGGGYGVALLSREEPLALRRIPLPGREEARVLLMAEFPECWLCVTHLSLTDEDQRAFAAAHRPGDRHLPQTRAAGRRLQHGKRSRGGRGARRPLPPALRYHGLHLPGRCSDRPHRLHRRMRTAAGLPAAPQRHGPDHNGFGPRTALGRTRLRIEGRSPTFPAAGAS